MTDEYKQLGWHEYRMEEDFKLAEVLCKGTDILAVFSFSQRLWFFLHKDEEGYLMGEYHYEL